MSKQSDKEIKLVVSFDGVNKIFVDKANNVLIQGGGTRSEQERVLEAAEAVERVLQARQSPTLKG